MANYFILTGKKGSGKTTSLFNFVKNCEKKCSGILTLTKGNERYFYSIDDEKEIIATTDKNSELQYLNIGKFYFLKKAFDFANSKILLSNKKENDFLIIDEAGFLELENKGFHKSLQFLLNPNNLNTENIIIVVRDFLVENVISHYSLNKNNLNIIKSLNF